jgi:ADP-ribosylglycohydrolase
VVPGRLLAGEHPNGVDDPATRARLQSLMGAGIDLFLDLTQPRERPDYQDFLPDHVRVVRASIRDMSVPADIATMRDIQSLLQEALAGGRRVYVHCRAGIGRTGTVIGCYLAETGLDGPAALQRLNELWQHNERSATWREVPQTVEQADFIRDWPRYRRASAEPAAVTEQRNLRERFLGCLLGGAIGDALSAASQYRRPGRFAVIRQLSGGGVFELPCGAYTDDTALTLVAADSLLECHGLQPADLLQRTRRWQSHGYMAAGSHCVGITPGTAAIVRRSDRGAPPPALIGPAAGEVASLSRVAAVALFHYPDADRIQQVTAQYLALFDPEPALVDTAHVLTVMLYAALRGEPLARVLQPRWEPLRASSATAVIARVFDGDPSQSPPAGLEPPWNALCAAREALARGGSFGAGALLAVNGGGDSDVIGTLYGQLAGAFYGYASIPAAWLGSLRRRRGMEALAERLWAAQPASKPGGQGTH